MNYFQYQGTIGLFFFFSLLSFKLHAAESPPVIYLIPGQGSDYRIFQNLRLDDKYELRRISYSVPPKGMSLKEFSKRLSTQIDTTRAYTLIGVSLGGMIATEMSVFMEPDQVIIISSAKCRQELPGRYKFQKKMPLYKLITPDLAKRGAQLLQPIVEPDRNNAKETCKSMLEDKDPFFIKRTITMIMEWERTECPDDIIHIHGDKDHTIPVGNVKYDFLIEDGSHMMVLTRAGEVSGLINEILQDNGASLELPAETEGCVNMQIVLKNPWISVIKSI
jgi:pimeloyl-ACP methyl ester carboxylesterase